MSANISVNVIPIIAKIGDWVKKYQRDLWTGVCLVLIGWSAYNVGVIRGRLELRPPDQQADIAEQVMPVVREQAVPKQSVIIRTDPRVVVSKSSTSKKYHYTWCSSGQKIKEENRIWFETAQAAEAAGYTLAGNCTP